MLRSWENVCKGNGTFPVSMKHNTLLLVADFEENMLTSSSLFSRHSASFCPQKLSYSKRVFLASTKKRTSLSGNVWTSGTLWESFLSWKERSYLTCSDLEGGDGLFQADCCLPVTTGADLRVEGGHVEQDAGLLQRQVLLAYRHSCERVVPEGQRWKLSLIVEQESKLKQVEQMSVCHDAF